VAHGSPAVGYKILYTNWRFCLFQCFHGCYILGGELVLELRLHLVCVHVSDVEAEVTVLRPVSGLSAASAGVRSGLSLLGRVYVHWDGIARRRVGVGKACGRSSLSGSGGHPNAAYAGSRKVGLSVGGVEGFIRGMVLVHPDGKVESGFGIRVCRSPITHSHKGCQDLTVEALAEFHHNCFWVRVARVLNEVLELVEVNVDRPSTLEVRCSFQHVYGRGFGVEGHEVFSELLFKINPVNEAELSGLHFVFEFVVRPATCTSSFHVGHCPDDLCEIVFEGFRAEVDVGSAGRQERLARGLVAIKLGGSGRLKKVLSPPRGGSGYRGGPGAAAGRGSDQVGHVSGLCGAEFVEDVL